MADDELWLMVKDSTNKRIKMHIKFDIEHYVQSNLNDVYNYINYAIGLIDDKNLMMLKKNIEYNLTGLKELMDKKLFNDPRLHNILFNIENSIIELVEWVNKTLDWQGVDLYKLKYVIDGILYAKIKINIFKHINFRTEQQELLLNNDIINILDKFNNKINWQITDVNRGLFIQNWIMPQWMAIANTINARHYIDSIKNLKIELESEKIVSEDRQEYLLK